MRTRRIVELATLSAACLIAGGCGCQRESEAALRDVDPGQGLGKIGWCVVSGCVVLLGLFAGWLLSRRWSPEIRFDTRSSGTDSERELAKSVLERYPVRRLASAPSRILITIFDDPLAGKTIATAHRDWDKDCIQSADIPAGFPSLPTTHRLSGNCKLIKYEFVERTMGGMGSWYGFEGYLLSVVADFDKGELLDCRGMEVHG